MYTLYLSEIAPFHANPCPFTLDNIHLDVRTPLGTFSAYELRYTPPPDLGFTQPFWVKWDESLNPISPCVDGVVHIITPGPWDLGWVYHQSPASCLDEYAHLCVRIDPAIPKRHADAYRVHRVTAPSMHTVNCGHHIPFMGGPDLSRIDVTKPFIDGPSYGIEDWLETRFCNVTHGLWWDNGLKTSNRLSCNRWRSRVMYPEKPFGEDVHVHARTTPECGITDIGYTDCNSHEPVNVICLEEVYHESRDPTFVVSVVILSVIGIVVVGIFTL